MDIFFLKLLGIIILIIIGLFCGLFPLKFGLSEKNTFYFSIGNSFAGGIFLGTALLHLLPEGLELLRGISDYPLAFLLAGMSLAGLLFLEKVVLMQYELHDLDRVQNRHSPFPFLLATGLSIHSLIAGLSLGIETSILTSAFIFIAIISHKGSASLALGISMRKAGFLKTLHIKVIAFFTMMTPIGILLGSSLLKIFSNSISFELEGIFDSLAAGTFLYISVLDIIEMEFSLQGNEWLKFFSIVVGFSLMAVLAIWS